MERSRLLDLMADPARGEEFTAADWVEVVRAARHSKLLPKVALLVGDHSWGVTLSDPVRETLGGARPVAAHHERAMRWEVNRICDALRGVETKLVLLKGAAYVLAGLPVARGRIATDVDILVPRADLRSVEQALLAAGWEPLKLDPYDQRYYREWSHELPPLQHRRRRTVVDVHHSILPLTGRLHPDPAKLLAAARPLHTSGFSLQTCHRRVLFTLSPADMVLHSAVHLFQDGELAGSVRDLVDVDALMRDFGDREAGFWASLVPRARELGLGRPLFYAARYARRLLDTPVPSDVESALAPTAPPAPVVALMDALVGRSLMPVVGRDMTFGEDTARVLLYARSHWLRMRPGRLGAHLWHKAIRRWRKEEESDA